MYSTHSGLGTYKTMNEVMLELSKEKINKAYRKDYKIIKEKGRYIPLSYPSLTVFAFYDTEAKKLVKFNGRNIWLSIDQFKDDWMIDTKKTDLRPLQDYVDLLVIGEDTETEGPSYDYGELKNKRTLL
jgi:hypothetical protein